MNFERDPNFPEKHLISGFSINNNKFFINFNIILKELWALIFLKITYFEDCQKRTDIMGGFHRVYSLEIIFQRCNQWPILCQHIEPGQRRFEEKITTLDQEQNALPSMQCKGAHVCNFYTSSSVILSEFSTPMTFPLHIQDMVTIDLDFLKKVTILWILI